ncbi:vacuolar-type H+-ATPase subunit I/STV1 [Geomicrobium halophilum]|uniref:Vacuolar-type H+-ATPase subunit I/STV1 n=1 Tax=Geomicrobium halophilum TaxID=549000 RepID=A0A841PRR8_9BACL|nr:hypothetical protein [Geomicrobium halophilum]MBB6450504.1 vacuolar-type H+-ATPase subunit I/STV1 [Geomicrobium halophilum]
MNHLLKGVAAITFSLLVLAGCGSEDEDFLNYLNGPYDEFLDMEEELDSLYDEYDAALADNDEEEAFVIVKEDLIPQLELMVEHVESVSVEDEEVQDLHDILVEETRLNLESMLTEEEAFEAVSEENDGEQSEQLLEERDELLNEVDAKRDEFINQMEVLMEEHDITYQ